MAANSNYYHGLQFRWATNGLTFAGFGTALIQSADNNNQLSEVTVMNQLGNTAIWAGHDLRKVISFEYVPASAATSDGTLLTSAQVPQQGVMVAITDSIDSNSTINGTNWIVQSAVERRDVVGPAKIVGTAIAFPAVTT